MLNAESRKYFNRAFLSSGTILNYYALSEGNHLARMQKSTQISNITELIEFLKIVDIKTLNEYNSYNGFDKLLSVSWGPTIENDTTTGAFITMRPEEMYALGQVSPIDIVFGFADRVNSKNDFTLKKVWSDEIFHAQLLGVHNVRYKP